MMISKVIGLMDGISIKMMYLGIKNFRNGVGDYKALMDVWEMMHS